MPPRRFSRHTFTIGYKSEDEELFISDREKFTYRELSDNIFHLVREGDTLQTLAAKYYSPLSGANGNYFSPATLWWVIADFQLPPIHDPTIELTPGSTVIVPSLRTVQERVFNPAKRA